MFCYQGTVRPCSDILLLFPASIIALQVSSDTKVTCALFTYICTPVSTISR